MLKDCIKVQEKKKKVVVFCSRPRENVSCSHAATAEKCTKKRDPRAKLLFCLTYCFFAVLFAVAVVVVA